MTDLEMMEQAAKAAGLEVHRGEKWQADMMFRAVPRPNSPLVANVEWNPITDDGDALRLAMALGLVVDCSRPSAGAPYTQHAFWLDDTMSTAELTRRAIVLAAAEIGRQR